MKNKIFRKLHIVSLGCSKNLIDSEVMGGQAAASGMVLVEKPDLADVVLINTCAFIRPAKEEALEVILSWAEIKKQSQSDLKIIVAGCLAQRYGKELLDEIPEVDLFIGTGEVGRFEEHLRELFGRNPRRRAVLSRPEFLMTAAHKRVLLPHVKTAYVKIAEGCSNACAYCAIPGIRGKARSRLPDDILLEVQSLTERGVCEIILIAQDTTAYGRDLKNRPTLAGLMYDLANLSNLRWLRLLYAHPAHLSSDLLETMAGSEKICRYLDLPVQHIDDTILKGMNRKVSSQTIRNLIFQARQMMPDVALRTSLMVGFPGETQRRFDRLWNFVKEARFDHLGVFTYSREEGTAAAMRPSRISENEKERRRDLILTEQADVSYTINQTLIGSVQEVILEEKSTQPGYALIGRCRRQAPEIDGVTHLLKGGAEIGDMVSCRIIGADHYDLFGEILFDKTAPPKL